MSLPRWAALLLATVALASSCAVQHDNPNLSGQDQRVTFLHIADIHSRLLPYRMQVMMTDKNLGLDQENEPFGGIARMAHIIHRERARSPRTVLVDSGDCFQGAPIFNAFRGEVEIKTMSLLQPDGVVVGNHEFDEGLDNYVDKLKRFSTFPTLAANYLFEAGNELGDLVEPYAIAHVDGLRVGIIGVANFSSLSSITDVGNSLKIIPLNIEQSIQQYIDILRPQTDLIVAVSHAGLSKDERLIQCTSGLDIVFGGHLHIALKPPKVVQDASGRDVVLVHSGAFAKYVGKLEVVTRDSGDPARSWEVVQHKYTLFPVDGSVPEDPKMQELLEPYRLEMNQKIDLTSVYAYTARLLTKYGYAGGDSSLGNFVAEIMREHARVDIGFTNTLGIRANMYPGVITSDELYNIFPFNNTIALMYMAGTDLRVLLDYVTSRSAGRGCVSQLQISGIEFTMNCNFAPPACRCDVRGPVCPGAIGLDLSGDRLYECYGRNDRTDRPLVDECRAICDCPDGAEWVSECRCPPKAEDIHITACSDPSMIDKTGCETWPLDESAVYEVATNDYIAGGGSGFVMLRNNNTQLDTGLPMRDAVLERLMRSPKCIEDCRDDKGVVSLAECATYTGCVSAVSTFYNQFCNHIADTTWGEAALPSHCAADTQDCSVDADCYNVEVECANGACAVCNADRDCEEDGHRCYAGFCRPEAYRCLGTRCGLICETDADCPGAAGVSAAQHLCVAGSCIPASDGFCEDEHDCATGVAHCYGGGAAVCTMDSDCPAGTICRERACIPQPVDCTDDAACTTAGLAGARCVVGRCLPGAETCTASSECTDGGECRGGFCTRTCQACAADDGCPSGHLCSEGFCVRALHLCDERRCRLRCDNDEGCAAGEVCRSGRCLPTVCTTPQDLETVCRLENLWKAQEQCLELPCPHAEADGRIQRILPENLENLPDIFDADNPEDIDENE